MGGFMDKLRELGEKIIPLMIVGLLGFGGWKLYKAGTFRNGLKPAINQIVSKVPYFGTRFRHYLNGSNKSYVANRSYKRGKKASGKGRHHYQGKKRRHRR